MCDYEALLTRRKGGRPTVRPTKEELNGLLALGMTHGEIAEHYGVKERTIRAWIQHFRKELES